jgi:hypothetical protein
MKKIALLSVFIICSMEVFSQEISENAIGLRFGDNNGFGGEISYQKKLNDQNRLEIDLGWRNSNNIDAVKLIGLYQWVWKIEDSFNWYAGVGAGIGSWKTSNDTNSDKDLFVVASGDIGIEYRFDIPLLISLDFRPEIGAAGYYENRYGSDIALALRYRF